MAKSAVGSATCYTIAAAMASFDLSYDADEDALEVTFELFDEAFARTVTLNDCVFLFTDLNLQAVWGITFYSFSKLLGVSETALTGLEGLADGQVEAVLGLLGQPPASLFFDVTDAAELIVRLRTPSVEQLVEA